MKILKIILELKKNFYGCGRCATGKYLYELDNHEPICPYMHCHNGKSCSRFVKIKNKRGNHLCKKIIKNIVSNNRSEKNFNTLISISKSLL